MVDILSLYYFSYYRSVNSINMQALPEVADTVVFTF